MKTTALLKASNVRVQNAQLEAWRLSAQEERTVGKGMVNPEGSISNGAIFRKGISNSTRNVELEVLFNKLIFVNASDLLKVEAREFFP